MPPIQGTLLLAVAVEAVATAAFLAVGLRIARRPVSAGARGANTAMACFWWALGAYLVLDAAAVLVAAFAGGAAPEAAYTAGRAVSGPLLAFGAGSLAYHVLYIFSGRAALWRPTALYYAAAALAYDAILLTHPATSVSAGDWGLVVVRDEPLGGPVWVAVLASIGLPMVLGSLAYLSMLRQVERREQRYRVVLVSSSILLWVMSGFVAQVAGTPFWQFATISGVGLLAALAVLAAYFPPAAVRRWLAAGHV